MALSGLIQPVINLPAKPPPFRSGYFPITVGGTSGGVALNFSNVGINNAEDFSRALVEVYAVTITNQASGDRGYNLRREDSPITGVVFLGATIPYIDAGTSGALASLGRMTRNNLTTRQGNFICDFHLPPDTVHTFPIEAVVNSGTLWVTADAVNEEVRAVFHGRAYPIIYPQRSG